MAGKREINYEVHVQQKGNWEIQARYPERKENAAIEDAVILDRLQNIDAVRVIKESYDPEEGISNDTVIYISPHLKKGRGRGGPGATPSPSQGRPPPSPVASGDWDMASRGARQEVAAEPPWGDESPEDDPPKQRKSGRRGTSLVTVIVKFLLVLLVCIFISGLFAWLASVWLQDSSLNSNIQTNILSAIFVATFLLSSGYTAYSMLSKANRPPKPRRTKPAPVRPQRKPKPKPANKRRDLPEPTPSMETMAESEKETPPKETAPEVEAPEEEPEKPEETKDEEKEEEKEEEEEKEKHLSPEAEKQKVFMLKFLGGALEKIHASDKKLDSFNKFGVNLYLSGACEVLSQERDMDAGTTAKVLSECVQVMGFKKSDADTFAGKYEEYLLADSRYMQMFQAGRNALNTYLEDESTTGNQLEKSLGEWNKPKEKEERTGPVTVMFTDMVGSTALTQTRGDAFAQKVVRTHNRIVRDALGRYRGREIKHTGDGIMCSFETTSDSIEAASVIQRQTAAHNKANPDLPLHLKIGINAGEPIAEDDDLFGTTVQLAARIVDKAQSEQIFVSEIVRGICAGKEIRFANRGGYAMKGFDGDLTLYEVVWDENAQT